jgi:hypothetical protein
MSNHLAKSLTMMPNLDLEIVESLNKTGQMMRWFLQEAIAVTLLSTKDFRLII